MKNFKNISVIATIAIAFTLSACGGITDANLSQADESVKYDSRDFQSQTDVSDQYSDGGANGEMIRVRPD